MGQAVLLIKNTRICESCPMCTTEDNIKICNSKKYIHPKTHDISDFYKKDYVRGCGCSIHVRAKNKCIIDKF